MIICTGEQERRLRWSANWSACSTYGNHRHVAFRFSLTPSGTGRAFTVLGSNTMTYEIAYMSAWMDVFVLVFWNSAIFFFVLFGKLTYVNLRPTTWPCTYSNTTHTCDVMQMDLSFGHARTILLEPLASLTIWWLPFSFQICLFFLSFFRKRRRRCTTI